MATLSSILGWRILRTEQPSGLQSMRSHRVRYDWSDLAVAAAANSLMRLRASDFTLYQFFLLIESRCDLDIYLWLIIFSYTFFFLTVLGSQQNWAESTAFPHTSCSLPHTQPLPLSIFPTILIFCHMNYTDIPLSPKVYTSMLRFTLVVHTLWVLTKVWYIPTV